MPKGGAREGAGRKSEWASGCKYSDTTLLRVPRAILEEVRQSAHDIDAGINYKQEVIKLREELAQLQEQLNQQTQEPEENLRPLLVDIMAKVDGGEKGFKSNGASQLIRALRNLLKS